MAVKRTEVVKQVERREVEETFTCDRCGEAIYEDDPPDENFYRQTLRVYLNNEQCVHSEVALDLCVGCVTPRWNAICEALGIDPDEEHRIDDY